MIRFIKNILDIKNLLGMQRTIPPVPDPAYPANQFVLRSQISGLITFIPIYNGTLHMQYTQGGVVIETDSPSGNSGTTFAIFNDIGEDLVITGNLEQITINGGVDFVAVNNTVDTIFDVGLDTAVLDMRNADNLVGLLPAITNIRTLYAIANNSTQRTLCKQIIDNGIDGGVLWIDRTQAYAMQVIASATAHSWTVNDL